MALHSLFNMEVRTARVGRIRRDSFAIWATDGTDNLTHILTESRVGRQDGKERRLGTQRYYVLQRKNKMRSPCPRVCTGSGGGASAYGPRLPNLTSWTHRDDSRGRTASLPPSESGGPATVLMKKPPADSDRRPARAYAWVC